MHALGAGPGDLWGGVHFSRSWSLCSVQQQLAAVVKPGGASYALQAEQLRIKSRSEDRDTSAVGYDTLADAGLQVYHGECRVALNVLKPGMTWRDSAGACMLDLAAMAVGCCYCWSEGSRSPG